MGGKKKRKKWQFCIFTCINEEQQIWPPLVSQWSWRRPWIWRWSALQGLWSSLDSSPPRCWCEHHSEDEGNRKHHISCSCSGMTDRSMPHPNFFTHTSPPTSSLIFFTDSPFCKEASEMLNKTLQKKDVCVSGNSSSSPCQWCFQPPADTKRLY